MSTEDWEKDWEKVWAKEMEKRRKYPSLSPLLGYLLLFLILCISGYFVYAFSKTAKSDVVESACTSAIYAYASQQSLLGVVSTYSRGKYSNGRLISTYRRFREGRRRTTRTNGAYFSITPPTNQKSLPTYMGWCAYDPWKKSTEVKIEGTTEPQQQ